PRVGLRVSDGGYPAGPGHPHRGRERARRIPAAGRGDARPIFAEVLRTNPNNEGRNRNPVIAYAAMTELRVLVQVLPHGEGLELPAYATPGSAGCDLRAALTEPLTLAPGARALVPTGLALAIPEGFEGQVRM